MANVRLTLHREDESDVVIFVGAHTKSDAIVGALNLLLPRLGFKFTFADLVSFGSHNTGSGRDVVISRKEA